MMRLDDQFLAEAGLADLPAEAKHSLLAAVYAELVTRVGTSLTARLTDTQLDEFQSLTQAHDRDAALAWLERTVPDHHEVTQRTLGMMRAELAARADDILDRVNGAA
jgi:hypothetical protein